MRVFLSFLSHLSLPVFIIRIFCLFFLFRSLLFAATPHVALCSLSVLTPLSPAVCASDLIPPRKSVLLRFRDMVLGRQHNCGGTLT